MSEYIWETFDSLFKTVHRQGRRVEELETRIADLERRLQEGAGASGLGQQQQQASKPVEKRINEMPAERAA